MSTRVSLPAPVWCKIADCLTPSECARTLDKVLNKSVKSERFKLKVKVENDRNLRIFWDALRYTARGSEYQLLSLPDFFQNFSDCLDPADVAFGRLPGFLPDSQATVHSIRRILRNPIVKQNLFPAVHSIRYHSSSLGAPSMLVKEISELVNLDNFELVRTVLTNGLGTFATPLDLRDLPHLRFIEIANTNIRDEDLLLSHRIGICSYWNLSERRSTKMFTPSLTTFAGWKDLISNLPCDLYYGALTLVKRFCSLVDRFCEALFKNC